MNTVIRPEKFRGNDWRYCVDGLENGVELQQLIREAESNLRPCAHCGATDASILYEYRPDVREPHGFCVHCGGSNTERGITFGCQIRTMTWRAEDDEENQDIKFALATVQSFWNRRPGEWESKNGM
jgi:hypothetical protein